MRSIQDEYIPDGVCFGCGPANPQGLGLRSFPEGDAAVAQWQPLGHHAAFEGTLCGGVIGTLLDCHSGAALAWAVHRREGAWPASESLPWVTAGYSVDLVRPTPMVTPVRLVANTVKLTEDEAEVEMELHSEGKLRATGNATWRRLTPRP